MINNDTLIRRFGSKFGIDKREILEFLDFYNRDYSKYDNRIYSCIEVRLTHWINQQNRTWFGERISILMDELYELRNVLFIDVGFSIPYLLMQKRFANRNDIFSILIDKEQNCKIFYDFINQTVHQNRSELDSVIIADIEYEEDQKSIISFAKNIVQRESVNVLFICGSELVEHLNDKENFWTFCKGIEEIGVNTLCYVTLPIGKKIPSHNFHFIDEDCAYLELEKHMILSKIEVLRPSADAVSPYLTSCFCAFGSIRHLPEEGNSR